MSFSGFGVMTMFKITKDQLDDIYREQETTKSNIASLNLKKNQSFIVILNILTLF